MSSILKISEAASIALHAMAILSQNSGNGLLLTKEISAKIKSSEAHLSKVLQRLEKAGLVNSSRGPKGGFQLAKKNSEISLMDIYEVIEGPIDVHKCLLPEPICKNNICIFGNLLIQINGTVKKYMQQTKLSSLKGFPPNLT